MNRLFALAICLAFIAITAAAAPAQESDVLTLEQAIATALEQNRSHLADQHDKKSADWGTAQSVSGYLPKVYFVSTWTRLDDQSVEEANQGYEMARNMGIEADRAAWEDMYQSRVSVVQPIFNGGQEIAAILAASTQRKERKYNLANRKLTLIRDVKTAYFSQLTTQQMMAVAFESVALAQESLNVAQARFELGQINRSKVLRWEANLAASEGAQIESENALESTRLSLINILGAPMNATYTLVPLTDDQVDKQLATVTSDSTASFPVPANVSAHPSSRQVDQSVALTKVERFSSVGMMLPNANFTYTYQWEQNDTMDLDGDENWSAGIQLEIPLFQSLAGVFGVGKSHHSVRKAQHTREDFTRGLLQQLRLAQLNIESAKKRVAASRKGQRYSEENLSLVQGRHKLGMASNLDLIDAKFAYTQARSDTIRATGDFFTALADYEYLTATSEK